VKPRAREALVAAFVELGAQAAVAAAPRAPETRDALAKVHVDATLVDDHVFHLQIGGLAMLLALKLDERVAQRLFRLPVAHHVAR
jgi:hypothetical protein